MTRRLNYVIETGPQGITERDAATCGHCQYQMILPPAKDGRVIVRVDPVCTGCGRFICHVCKAEGIGCKTWEKRMEEMESKSRMVEAILGG